MRGSFPFATLEGQDDDEGQRQRQRQGSFASLKDDDEEQTTATATATATANAGILRCAQDDYGKGGWQTAAGLFGCVQDRR
jgi:hypothetical protein